MTTSIHTFSISNEASNVLMDAQYEARKKRSTMSKEISQFIVDYHEQATRPIELKDSYSINDFNLLKKWNCEHLERLKSEDVARLRTAVSDRQHDLLQLHALTPNELATRLKVKHEVEEYVKKVRAEKMKGNELVPVET